MKLRYLLFTFVISFQAFSQEDICSRWKTALDYRTTNDERHLRNDLSFNDYDLVYQELEFWVDPDTFFIRGKVTSQFEILTDGFNKIHFDLFSGLIVDSIIYEGLPLTHSFPETDLLEVNLLQTLNEADKKWITIYYHGIPASNGMGSFVKDIHEGVSIIWTLSQPYGARDWWPCKQSLSDKIDSVDLIIHTPKGYKAASNGILIRVDEKANEDVHYWKHRYPIATYLVAIAVTNYAQYSDYVVSGNDSFEILNYVYPEDSAMLRPGASFTVDIMELFISLFGPYPFEKEKYGHAQFGRGGGMEHQTMSFMGDLDADLVAHELAHQWFGDMVTCQSWSDIWLNEGFATYSEGLYREHLVSEENFYDWRNDRINYIMRGTNGSVYVYKSDTQLVGRVFDYRTTYLKGGMVIHMLRYVLGDSVFFKGLTGYLNDPNNQYGYANTEDLKAHLEKVSGTDLDEFFRDWVYREGYPVYKIYWNQFGHELKLEVNQEAVHPSVDFFEMPVEFYIAGEGMDTLIRLNNEYNLQRYILDIPFAIDTIIFDPGKNIIAESGVFQSNRKLPENFFDVFPNPGNDRLMIRFSVYTHVEKIMITDILGRNVKVIHPSGTVYEKGEKLEINVEDLRPSNYIIRLDTGEKIITSKLLIH